MKLIFKSSKEAMIFFIQNTKERVGRPTYYEECLESAPLKWRVKSGEPSKRFVNTLNAYDTDLNRAENFVNLSIPYSVNI